MLPVDSVVELLELKQILVCRTERAHLVVLADILEKHHGGSFVACSHSCPPILLASKFAEPGVALIEQSEGLDKVTASLPFHFRHMPLMFSLVASASFGAKGPVLFYLFVFFDFCLRFMMIAFEI
jgi:hypothetical protein